MILTTRIHYAVIAITEIASKNTLSPMRLADISKSQNVPLNYLEKIFLQLKNAGLVSSVRGPGGGYYLNHTIDKISIEDIIDALGESLKMTNCSKNKDCRQNGTNCKAHNLWKNLGKHIRTYVANISIADIISENLDRAN